jgi:hypothetical protein
MKLESSLQIFEEEKKVRYQVLSKSVQWEPSCSMRTDGQTCSSSVHRVMFSHGVVVSAVTGTQVLGLPLFEFTSGFVVVCLSGYICSSASISVMSG